MVVTEEAPVLGPEGATQVARLRDEDVMGIDGDIRAQLGELGRRLKVDARETIIFIHRKFIIVAYKW
jgi:hypothetical protein